MLGFIELIVLTIYIQFQNKKFKKSLKTLSFKINKVDANTYSLSLYELKFQVWLYSVEFEQSYCTFSYL